MAFYPKRKRSSPTTNPFGRKLSPEAASARDAPRGVQQSLFSAIRNAGYEGSAASSIAWRLIKAVRPKMVESAMSLAQVSECPREELEELRACAVTSSGKESVSSDPNRGEIIGDIIAMLDGLLSRSAAPLASPVAPPAPLELAMRRDARALELFQAGVPAEDAGRQAAEELAS